MTTLRIGRRMIYFSENGSFVFHHIYGRRNTVNSRQLAERMGTLGASGMCVFYNPDNSAVVSFYGESGVREEFVIDEAEWSCFKKKHVVVVENHGWMSEGF